MKNINIDNKIEKARHSLAHILAMSVQKLYKETKLAIGPTVDGGFYYDFDLPVKITKDDFSKIEKEMRRIVNSDAKFEFVELSKAEAKEIFKDNEYKLELIDEMDSDETISAYKTDEDFIDLCRGPHIEKTSQIQNWAFKIDRVSGAYWRGDENNKMLTRIYVFAFPGKKELSEFIVEREKAIKNDHNKLGRELDLFTTNENVGKGLPLIMPRGAKIINILQRFVEDEGERRGYEITKTPFMGKSDLYKISGHWNHYKDGMFIIDEDKEDKNTFALRPMTCPFQFMIYKNDLRSYKDLPIKYLENSTLFRNESSGEMHGLTRIRQFNLSDAHIICRPDQLEAEFKKAMDFIHISLKAIGLEEDVWYRFSKWDPNKKDKYIDNPKAWEGSQKMLKKILDELNFDYVEADDEAAFYGPKLDIQAKNVFGKEDTILTIQVDFALPERFDMTYIDNEGQKKRPFIIHQSIMGCYERTLASLIEKYGGKFPLWLAPEQVRVMSVADDLKAEAEKLKSELADLGVRATSDTRNEKIGYKIREAQTMKVPYMIILGKKELEEGTVSVRDFFNKQQNDLNKKEFIKNLLDEIDTKKIKKLT